MRVRKNKEHTVFNDYLKGLAKKTGKSVSYYEYDSTAVDLDNFIAAQSFFKYSQNDICIFNGGPEPVFSHYRTGGWVWTRGYRILQPYVDVWTSSIGEDIPDNWWYMPYWLKTLDKHPEGSVVLKEYTTKEDRPIKLFCWMRRQYQHRVDLADALWESGNMKNIEFVFPHQWVEAERELPEQYHLKNYMKNYEAAKDYIGTEPIGHALGENGARDTFGGYTERLDRMCELVSETRANDPYKQIFYSEKTFRIMRTGQLGLWWAYPGSVAGIKDMGFKVFEKWINHEYDTIEDYKDRLKALMDEVTRLTHLSDQEWLDIWEATHPDRIYNQTHLLNNLPNETEFMKYAQSKN